MQSMESNGDDWKWDKRGKISWHSPTPYLNNTKNFQSYPTHIKTRRCWVKLYLPSHFGVFTEPTATFIYFLFWVDRLNISYIYIQCIMPPIWSIYKQLSTISPLSVLPPVYRYFIAVSSFLQNNLKPSTGCCREQRYRVAWKIKRLFERCRK